MLPKEQRLTSVEVEEVMSKGQSILGGFFLTKFLKADNSEFKVSAIAPKKTFKTAVERNKARRRIYSALSPILNKNLIKNSFLVAFVGNKRVLSEKITTLSAEIEQILVKGGIL